MFRHILVPLDGSLRAERAIPVAARIARASEGILILLRVVQASACDQEISAEAPLYQEATRSELAEARQYLTVVASMHQLAGLAVIISVSREPVIKSIQTTIHTYQADLLVCCEQRTLAGPQRFLGSFAEYLGQHLSIPLLLLPEQEPPHYSLAEWQESITCLVAFAGSQPEPFLIQPATSLLAAFAGHESGRLHCVPLRSLQSHFSIVCPARQVSQADRERVRSTGRRAVLFKEGQRDERREGSGERGQQEIVVVGMPLLGVDRDSLQDIRTHPRLLVPSPMENKRNLSHL